MRIDDHSFSEQLRLHASSLDLEDLAPVGAWDYGQSIRRAKNKTFFYDLSVKSFYPLGLHHPLMLRSAVTDTAPVPFVATLADKLPVLAQSKWIVLSAAAYGMFKQNKPITELKAFTISSIWGLKEFENTKHEFISVRLSDGCVFVVSSHELPASDTLVHHGWLNLFLSPEVLGPAGRLAAVQKFLVEVFDLKSIQGLSFTHSGNAVQLSQRGLCVDEAAPKEVVLHFPVSVLKRDVEAIHQLITRKDALC